MKAADIKDIAERRPFRPFSVRLNNGAQYTFSEPRNFAAPKDYRVIFYFGDSDWTMLDLDSIAEVIQQ
ncbi:MAG: hypothetical protein HY735_09690 [Verrucomicrobia bacterium]|nr:hypothetical protein [Verrucomicrobiota bacterium]